MNLAKRGYCIDRVCVYVCLHVCLFCVCPQPHITPDRYNCMDTLWLDMKIISWSGSGNGNINEIGSESVFDIMTHFFDDMMCFCVMTHYLTSWRTIWRHDMFLKSWQTFWNHDKHDSFFGSPWLTVFDAWRVFDAMTKFVTSWRTIWRYDVFVFSPWLTVFDVMTCFWSYSAMFNVMMCFDVMTHFFTHAMTNCLTS